MKNKSPKQKPAAKRTAKKAGLKSPKRRRFVAGLIEGKSMYRAALGAGYTESMARNAGLKILPGARDEFKEALARRIPQAKLIQRLAEGLDAKETKLAQFEGDFNDARQLVDYAERRRYAELIAKLRGFLVEQVELGGRDDGQPLNFNLQVNFVDRLSDAELEDILIESRQDANPKGETNG